MATYEVKTISNASDHNLYDLSGSPARNTAMANGDSPCCHDHSFRSVWF